MLKIAVFDGGWGGEAVANFLAAELAVVEIVRITNREKRPYEEMTKNEICRLAEKHLQEYIGKTDLIVLGGYMSSLALDALQKRHPEQKFVGMSIDYRLIHQTRRRPRTVTVLADAPFVQLPVWQELRSALPDIELVVPDCRGWESLIDIGEMSAEVLKIELKEYFQLAGEQIKPLQRWLTKLLAPEKQPFIQRFWRRVARVLHSLIETDTILLLNTHYWTIKPALQEIFGSHVRVLDFRQKLLHDVCLALKLRGVDGNLGK